MPFESVCEKSLNGFANWFTDRFCLGENGRDIFFSLVSCCLNRTSIDDLNSDRTPCPDVVLKLGRVPLDLMTAICNELLGKSFEQARCMRLFSTGDVLCLDYHDVVYHGREQEYTVKSLRESHLRRVFRYGVSGVCRQGMFYTSRIRPCKKGEDTGDIVRELVLDQTPRQVLMDRFFGAIRVFDTIEVLGKEYIVPCKQTEAMDELYKKSLLAGTQTLKHKMRKHSGGSRQVDVYFTADEKYEYTSYFSNIAVPENMIDDAIAVYKIRWNIENQFKKKKEVQAKTSSPSPSYRLLLETISHVLCNLWRLLVKTVQPVTMKKTVRILNEIIRLLREEPSSTQNNTPKGLD